MHEIRMIGKTSMQNFAPNPEVDSETIGQKGVKNWLAASNST